jgi:glycosyltransferase involved in cell wall biosynthesis
MRLFYLTAGTGSFFCGTCLRDATLVQALRALGHDALLAPLYLPLVLENDVPSERVHLGGLNAYLAQSWGARLPRFVQDWLDAPWLLRLAARGGEMTRASELGALTLSMLRGEESTQVGEVRKLCAWLRELPRPDVVLLSNALLIGLARPLARELGCPVLCTLQGEAPFLDALAPPHRAEAWREIARRASDLSAFLPVSRYTADLMRERLGLRPETVHVVPNGIDTAGYVPPARRDGPPTIGYVARLCRDKGLETLVEAFRLLRQRKEWAGLRLVAAGACLRGDRPALARLARGLDAAGLAGAYEFHENVTLTRKLECLRRATVFSVPATYGESFGLYLLEAWAMGLPVVQPEHGAFPELLNDTGGGILCRADDPAALAEALASLLADPARAQALGEAGRRAVLERYGAERMARDVERIAILCAPRARAAVVAS